MAKPARLTVMIWIITLCLCLCACDMETMLGGFGLGEPEDTTPTPAPTLPPVVTLPPETEAPTEPTPTLPPPDPGLYWVCAAGGLRVRQGPDRSYETEGLVDDGTVVRPLRWSGGWAYIDYPLSGWCSGDYLYPLGWYKDVKMPLGTVLQDISLTGKWIHATQPVGSGNQRRSRVGLYELRGDGTFTHSVAEYATGEDGEWRLVSGGTDRPQWVGEYQFDGKTLTMNYMAYADQNFSESGLLVSRQYLSAPYILELDVTLSPDSLRFTVSNGEMIPCFAGYGTSSATISTLYRASGSRDFPKDVCEALKKWFS